MSYRDEIRKRTIRSAPQVGKHHGEGPSDGAQRNARIAAMVADRKEKSRAEKEQKIADRTAAAEKRRKETLAMAKEENLDEVSLLKPTKTFDRTELNAALKKHNEDMKRLRAEIAAAKKAKAKAAKAKPVAEEEDIEEGEGQHRVKWSYTRGAPQPGMPKSGYLDKKFDSKEAAEKHAKKMGMGSHLMSYSYANVKEETGTEARTKIKNVARPGDPAPTSEKSTLTKTGEIKVKKVDEEIAESLSRKYGLTDSLIAAARSIVEGKTKINMSPETNDKIDDDDDMKTKNHKQKLSKVSESLDEATAADIRKKMSKHEELAIAANRAGDDEKTKHHQMKVQALKQKLSKMMSESSDDVVEEGKQHTTPKSDKEKKLASLAHPKDKITHKDVLVGRGVLAKEGVSYVSGKDDPWSQGLHAGKTGKSISQNPHKPGSEHHGQWNSGHAYAQKLKKEETEIEEVEQIDEVLSKKAPAGEWIKDFQKSDNPKFAGKSPEKRKQMALAAYYAKQRNEEVEELDELSKATLKSYEKGANKDIKHARADIQYQNRMAKDFGVKPEVRDSQKTIAKRSKGIDLAKAKTNLSGRTSWGTRATVPATEEVDVELTYEELEELEESWSRGTSYSNHADRTQANKHLEKANDHLKQSKALAQHTPHVSKEYLMKYHKEMAKFHKAGYHGQHRDAFHTAERAKAEVKRHTAMASRYKEEMSEELEELEEVSRGKIKNYLNRAFTSVGQHELAGNTEKAKSRRASIDLATRKGGGPDKIYGNKSAFGKSKAAPVKPARVSATEEFSDEEVARLEEISKKFD